MMFLLLRIFSILLTVLVFGLIAYISYKKIFRGLLFTEKMESELIDASEKFQEKRVRRAADKIASGEDLNE